MLKQIEGSRAVAEAVALCRPEVICAYPISPQTHIVEGLGGRAITRASLARMLRDAVAGRLEPLTFLDLDQPLVERALAREREQRRSGPLAEAILRDLGVVAARPG